jgi:hypothetical protein
MQKLNTFSGGINTDSNEHFIEDGDYIDALNIESVSQGGDNLGVLKNIKGNQAVNFSGIGVFPTGIHTCIGSVCDGDNDVILFLHNSNGDHFISAGSEVLRISPEFNFSRQNRISHATVLNEQFLIWTDGDIGRARSSFTGNPVRMLDIKKASRQQTYETRVTSSTARNKDFEFTIGAIIALEIWGVNNALVNTLYLVVDAGATGNGLEGSMLWLKGKIETALSGYTNVSVEYCDNGTLLVKSSILISPEHYYILKDFVGTSVFSYAENFYENDLTEYNINLYAYHPTCSPELDFLAESPKGKRYYQFRTRYVYSDGRKSTWSDISLLSLRQKYDMTYEIPSDFDVRLVDVRLNDRSFRAMISRVEFAVREGDNGVWKRIDKLNNDEIGNGLNVKVQFNGAKIYPVIESDDNTVGTNQTLKIFDHLPIVTDTLDVASDSTGGTRLFIGGGIEGYELPCVNTDYLINSESVGLVDMIKITGEVRIISQVGLSTTPDFDNYNKGFPVYLAGTPYFAISDNPANANGQTGTFSFYVPHGEYLLRVANWKCRYDDDNGSVYNLSAGLEWQNTSSPVMGFNGVSVGNELIIDTSFAVGGVLDIGYIEIHNQHYLIEDVTWISGYLRDNFANSETHPLRRESIGMPSQNISTSSSGVGLKTYTTDHNGYFFLCYDKHSSNRFEVFDFEVEVRNNSTTQILRYADYISTEQDRIDGTDVFVDGIGGVGAYSPEYTNGYVCLYANWWGGQMINLRKNIRGQVVDTNGDPVSNVVIAMQSGGTTRSDENGNYSIVGFTPVTSAILPVYLYAHPFWDFLATISITTNPIFDTTTLTWSTPINLEDMDFELSIPAPPITTRWLKAGGGYKIGMGYADKFGRKTPVIPLHEVEIPYHSTYLDLVKQSIAIEINHQAPDWADKWFLYRTKNTIHENYAQISISEVRYSSISADGTIKNATFEKASHLLIRLKTPQSVGGETGISLFSTDTERIGYAVSEGDLIRPLISGENLVLGDDESLTIDGIYTDTDNAKVWNIVRNSFGNELKAGDIIEVFTPSIVDRDIYYVDSCYDISEDINGRWHSGDIDQELGIPAYTRFKGGDTYWRYRDYYNDSYMSGLPLENINITDTFTSSWEDIGIANVEDPDYTDRPYRNRVRFSNLYIKDSNINGLSSFRGTDFISVGSELGEINALKNVMDNLLAICNFDTQAIYIGKSPLLDLSGNTQVGRSNEIMNIGNNTRLQHGTKDPSSIFVSDGRLFCYDKNRKKFWRYSGNGVQWINGFFDTYLKANILATDILVATVDLEKSLYKVLLVEEGGDELVGREVLNYDFLSTKWKPRESFTGHWIWYSQRYGLETFKESQIWRHNTNLQTLYGEDFTSIITFTTKGLSGDNVFKAILLNATAKPFLGSFETKQTSMTPQGQYTEALAGMWRDTMNKVATNIPRDHRDIRFNTGGTPAEIAAASIYGRVMKGETLEVSLTFNSNFELINSVIDTIEFKNT